METEICAVKTRIDSLFTNTYNILNLALDLATVECVICVVLSTPGPGRREAHINPGAVLSIIQKLIHYTVSETRHSHLEHLEIAFYGFSMLGLEKSSGINIQSSEKLKKKKKNKKQKTGDEPWGDSKKCLIAKRRDNWM